MLILGLLIGMLLEFLSFMAICFLPSWLALSHGPSGFTSIIPWAGVVFFNANPHYAP